ncbi:MAG: permease [Clostridia bacterium]|nr:permease [Clostridia bacterium]
MSFSGVTALLLGVFLVAFLGYLIGSVNIKGISLGTSGVFLVAILFGCLCTIRGLKDLPIIGGLYIGSTGDALYGYYGKIVQNIGLVLFVAAVGFIAGPSFFKNLKKNAKSYVVLGVVIIAVGALLAVLFALIPNIGSKFSIGILSGSLTTTPGYSAALEATKEVAIAEYEALGTAAGTLEEYISSQQAIVTLGHAVAYPFGVLGVVLFVQIIPKFLKADMNKERALLSSAFGEEIRKREGLFVADPFGLLPFGLAVVLGLILGAIKIPLTGKGYNGTCFSLGTTGGVLIMCLIFGHFGRMGKLSLELPEKTAKVFRETGLMLFLIGAGVSGGVSLVTKISSGELAPIVILYGFLAGIVMTIVPMIIGFFIAKKALKINLLNNLGSITGGMTSTPALGTLIKVADTDDVAGAYAATYPVALVLVVLVSHFVITLI